MPSKVLTIGFEIPGDVAEYVSFKSDKSLFDADVIIFTPTFEDYDAHESYAGKPLLSESSSERVVRDCKHWRQEIKEAVEAGKTVFVFLQSPEDVYYDTGQRSFSGTGRSQRTTHHVSPTNSFQSIPHEFKGLTAREGTEISIVSDLGPLSPYWAEFRGQSKYEVYFDTSTTPTDLLATKNGERCVGKVLKTKAGGALVFLPMIRWDSSSLTYTKGESVFWKKEALASGKRFLQCLIAAAQAYKKQGNQTPTPAWAIGPEYYLVQESEALKEAESYDSKIHELTTLREDLRQKAQEISSLRALLFESGKPLELAVVKALRILGFKAEPYADGESEFDAVFNSPEGRFLGEVEGKDSKAINIDKMSQLERNIQEDFAREGITEYAKGVLFGNAYRLVPPTERGEYFTEKAQKAAKRLSAALIRTPDLFEPVRYLSETSDPEYAKACREAIFNSSGDIVTFPNPTVQGEKGGA